MLGVKDENKTQDVMPTDYKLYIITFSRMQFIPCEYYTPEFDKQYNILCNKLDVYLYYTRFEYVRCTSLSICVFYFYNGYSDNKFKYSYVVMDAIYKYSYSYSLIYLSLFILTFLLYFSYISFGNDFTVNLKFFVEFYVQKNSHIFNRLYKYVII